MNMRELMGSELFDAHQAVLFWAKRLSYKSADIHPEWKTNYENAKKRLEELKKSGGKAMFEYFKDEIIRAYNVLGVQGEFQNERDIEEWFKKGMINESEYEELKRLNRR